MKSNGGNGWFRKIFSFQRNPEYFNGKFHLLMYLINGLFLFYIIISFLLYIFYHIFGDLYIFSNRETYALNENLQREYLQNYSNNDISLLWNIPNCVILLFFFFLSKVILEKQSFILLFIYLLFQKIYMLSYFMNINLTLIPHRTSFIYRIFNYLLIIPYLLILFYSFSFWKKQRRQNKNSSNPSSVPLFERESRETGMGKYRINNPEQMSIDNVVEEVQISLDMAKIQFNQLMIKLGLSKIFRRFLFNKEDYYFMNKQKKEKDKKIMINNIKGKNSETNNSNRKKEKNEENKPGNDNNNSISDSYEINSTTYASNDGYSRLDDDNENNPLKP